MREYKIRNIQTKEEFEVITNNNYKLREYLESLNKYSFYSKEYTEKNKTYVDIHVYNSEKRIKYEILSFKKNNSKTKTQNKEPEKEPSKKTGIFFNIRVTPEIEEILYKKAMKFKTNSDFVINACLKYKE
ncbi:MAG: hypothetical protein GY870_13895 [archaeon]|nr:hypothetical protein [archaeon]